MPITRKAKKAITPKQKKVTVLSVVGPARPTPFSARAAGAATSIRAQVESRAATVRFTGGNLPHRVGAGRDGRVSSQTPAISVGPGCENPVNAAIYANGEAYT